MFYISYRKKDIKQMPFKNPENIADTISVSNCRKVKRLSPIINKESLLFSNNEVQFLLSSL